MIYTSEDIKAYRDKNGCSLQEAKKHFVKQEILDRLDRATTLDSLRDIIQDIIENVY